MRRLYRTWDKVKTLCVSIYCNFLLLLRGNQPFCLRSYFGIGFFQQSFFASSLLFLILFASCVPSENPLKSCDSALNTCGKSLEKCRTSYHTSSGKYIELLHAHNALFLAASDYLINKDQKSQKRLEQQLKRDSLLLSN